MTIDFNKQDILNIEKQYRYLEDQVSDLLLFVGHAHSGHSIVGSILDCHQDIVLANEVNIVKAVRLHKLTAIQIEAVLLHEAKSTQEKWLNSAYQYDINSSHQGQIPSHPKIIGDKKAGGTTRIFCNDPWVLDYLLSCYGSRLKVMFVKRNPLDVVAAYSYYMQQPVSQFHVDRYIENLMTVRSIEKQLNKNQFLQVNQDSFIKNPLEQIKLIFKFLSCDGRYSDSKILEWCSIVRDDIKGKSELINLPIDLSSQLEAYL